MTYPWNFSRQPRFPQLAFPPQQTVQRQQIQQWPAAFCPPPGPPALCGLYELQHQQAYAQQAQQAQQAQLLAQGFGAPHWAGAAYGQPAPIAAADPRLVQQHFESAIHAAKERYGKNVRFQMVHLHDDTPIGCLVSSRDDTPALEKGKRPILLVAGAGMTNPSRPHMLSATSLLQLRSATGASAAIDFVREARDLPAPQSLPHGPLALVPDLQLCPDVLSPEQAAAVLDEEAAEDGQPVQIFLPTRAAPVYLSTLRHLEGKSGPGAIAYIHTPPRVN